MDNTNIINLILDSTDEIKSHISHAYQNEIDLDTMIKIVDGKLPPIGDNPDYERNFGEIRVVFTIEEHPSSVFRHISISLNNEELTDDGLINLILDRYGYSNQIDGCFVYSEVNAVNILEPL